MDSKKVSIIGLVVIGILFAVGLGRGLFRENKPVAKNEREQKARDQAGWANALQNGLDWMGLIDEIDVGRLSVSKPSRQSSNCQGGESGGNFVVTMGAGCGAVTVQIDAADAADEQELTLAVRGECSQGRDFSRLKAVTSTRVIRPTIKPGSVTATQGGTSAAETGTTMARVKKISFKDYDTGETATQDKGLGCGDAPAKLIIMPAGGELTLECEGCTDGKKLQLQLG